MNDTKRYFQLAIVLFYAWFVSRRWSSANMIRMDEWKSVIGMGGTNTNDSDLGQ